MKKYEYVSVHVGRFIGAKSKEEAKKRVSIGDYAAFDTEFSGFGTEKIKAKALDDRIGCMLLIEALKKGCREDLYACFTVQEEVGLRGAAVAGNTLQCEYSVVVDATTAADTAGVPTDKQVCCVGGGPVVSFMDRRTVYDKELYTHIRRLAEENDIPVQTKTMVAGGNDAGSFQPAGIGSRVAAVSLPCRYIHSPSCVLAHKDVDHTLQLLSLLMNTLPAWDSAV